MSTPSNSDSTAKADISPATLEALKILSTISVDKLTNCNKLTASLEQIRTNKNINLFEKLSVIRQDFIELNNKISQMEESLTNLKEMTTRRCRKHCLNRRKTSARPVILYLHGEANQSTLHLIQSKSIYYSKMSKHPEGYCPVFGNYPKEYNRAVHGPYYPHVNYGPRDTPFSEVKLGEFKEWFSRRNKTPQSILAALSRTSQKWVFYWHEPRLASPSKPFLQIAFLTCFASMLTQQKLLRAHRNHKYHW